LVKAYRLNDFSSLDDLTLQDEDAPRPQRGEVLVRVYAVSLNFRDIAMLRGRYPLPHRKNLVPTSDGAGEVAEVGPGVEDFKAGDRVMGTFHSRWHGGRMPPDVSRHGYGSEIDGWRVALKVVSQESLVRIPDALSFEEASTLPCAALTAWSALTLGTAIRSGHTVLTQGTGGVSI
jgi:alcohol dehydrogenase